MTETLFPLILAAVSFVGSHFFLSSTPARGRLVAKLGKWGFAGFYSVVAAGMFAWMFVSYSRAPLVDLWHGTAWAHNLALALMPVVASLLVCGALTPNPTAVGGASLLSRDDPAPGIFKLTRHPVMWAVALWAALHILSTGDAASVIFFGALTVLAIGGMVHMDARGRHGGGDGWSRLAAVTSLVPFAAAAQGRTRISLSEIGWWRILLGLALYAVAMFGHERFAGVDITPW